MGDTDKDGPMLLLIPDSMVNFTSVGSPVKVKETALKNCSRNSH